ncbi:hypothetical protein MRB53_006015 [Persea americana]|uniref:Uncharacterized protein n=1 Tax=Persea americana TaxID=3435 RepID=A0ACC2MGI9_PERAE|nr:hypothetical protein MRB53_006015 [Persea americana]
MKSGKGRPLVADVREGTRAWFSTIAKFCCRKQNPVQCSGSVPEPDLAILFQRPRDGSAGDPPSPATAAATATSAVSSRSPATRSGNSGLVAAEIPSDWAACDFLHDDETTTRSGDLSPVPAIFFSTVNGFLYALQCTDRTGNKQIVSDHLVICAALLADPITPSPTDPLKIRSVRSPSITPTML